MTDCAKSAVHHSSASHESSPAGIGMTAASIENAFAFAFARLLVSPLHRRSSVVGRRSCRRRFGRSSAVLGATGPRSARSSSRASTFHAPSRFAIADLYFRPGSPPFGLPVGGRTTARIRDAQRRSRVRILAARANCVISERDFSPSFFRIRCRYDSTVPTRTPSSTAI